MDKITNFNSPVTDNIIRIIDEKGLKQKSVAENSGFTPQMLSDVINGRRILKISEVGRLANSLGVPINDLFKTDE